MHHSATETASAALLTTAVDAQAPIAKLDLDGGRTVLVTYASDAEGNQSFGLALEGTHTADWPLGTITIDPTGRTTRLTADAERSGFDVESSTVTPLHETVHRLAELINTAMVARDYGIRLTGAGHSLLRALMASTAQRSRRPVVIPAVAAA
jgi:hypothetical protein